MEVEPEVLRAVARSLQERAADAAATGRGELTPASDARTAAALDEIAAAVLAAALALAQALAELATSVQAAADGYAGVDSAITQAATW